MYLLNVDIAKLEELANERWQKEELFKANALQSLMNFK